MPAAQSSAEAAAIGSVLGDAQAGRTFFGLGLDPGDLGADPVEIADHHAGGYFQDLIEQRISAILRAFPRDPDP